MHRRSHRPSAPLKAAAAVGVWLVAFAAAPCSMAVPVQAPPGPVVPVEVSAAGVLTATLRSSVVAPEGSPLTVADIADLVGDAALVAAVSGLAVETTGTGAGRTVDAAALRRAIDAAGPRVSSRVAVRGSRCTVNSGATGPVGSEPVAAAGSGALTDAAEASPDTLRGRIAGRLAELYATHPSDLRLKLVPTGRTPAGVLDLPPRGVRVEVVPGGGVQSGRLPLRVDEYDGAAIVRTLTLSAELLVRRDVLIARTPLDRERPIAADELLIEERWVSPTDEASPAPERVVGLAPRRRIDAGRPVVAADVQSEVVAERGDQVWVHYLGQSVTVKARGRTLDRARDGEVVRIQIDGSKSAIRARMSGRGNAVVSAGDAGTPEPLRGSAGSSSAPRTPAGPRGTGQSSRPPVRTGPVTGSGAAPAALAPQPDDGLTVSERARKFTPPSRR